MNQWKLIESFYKFKEEIKHVDYSNTIPEI